jgi:hypothetical protein
MNIKAVLLVLCLSGCGHAPQLATIATTLAAETRQTPVAPATPTITTTPILAPAPQLPTPAVIQATATPTPVKTILPTSGKWCAPNFTPVPCEKVQFGDGKPGTLLVTSKPPHRAGLKFIYQGNHQSYPFVRVCNRGKCYTLPFDACANPDSTAQGPRLRAHYYAPAPTNLTGPATVEFGDCTIRAGNIQRND